jgi:pimeloyl-ACP methyl ester carboxylesterase
LLIILVATFLLLCGAAAYRVHCVTTAQPDRSEAIDFESMELEVEAVAFRAADGIALEGWLIRGESGMPAILLCHDFGSDKASLINLAIALRMRGFTLLLFDFRGHGASAPCRSTLGILEQRDILGAFDLLSSMEWLENDEVGLYGVGMGAHAGVLASADQPGFRVLVLDSLYPDVSYELVRSFFGGWEFGVRRMPFIPRSIFRLVTGESAAGNSAASTIGNLPGRDLLMLAAQEDDELTVEMKKMYLTIPDQTDADGNLLIVPATRAGALYGEQLDSYHHRVADFFLQRLATE